MNHERREGHEGAAAFEPWTPERITAVKVQMRMEREAGTVIAWQAKGNIAPSFFMNRITGMMGRWIADYGSIEELCAALNENEALRVTTPMHVPRRIRMEFQQTHQ